MFQKLHSKLLSIVLCLAICCTALCGSIIGVNAAAADYNGTYTISVGDDKQAVPFGATEVKAQVKFDLPAGFVGGQFTAKAQSNYTIGNEASAVAGTKKDGTALTADELASIEVVTKANGNNKEIRFVFGDGSVYCTSITIEYTLVFTGSNYSQESTNNRNGYPVSIDVDGANFGVLGDYANVTFTGSDTAFHSHSAWFDLNAIKGLNEDGTLFPNGYAAEYIKVENEKNGKHTVASASCPFCENKASALFTDSKDKELYKRNVQIFPDITEFDGKTTLKTTTGWCGISGVTVNYNDNGSLDVNVHVYSQYRSGTVDLLICDKDGNELYRLPCVADGTSYFAGNGFPTKEKMFTITGLSAKNIDTELLLTVVEYGDGTNLWLSRTMSFCLADYCQNVVDGNSAVWSNDATSEQIDADKDLAAALYYYGASIGENVFDKNTSGGGNTSAPSIPYVQLTSDTWDGTQVEPTKTDSNGNILITTAEELAWIALKGDAATAGKSYKVADGIGAFYLTPNGAASYDNSSFDRLKETLTASTDLKGSTLNKWVCKAYVHAVGGWASFQGSFDGNGITIYGLPGQSTETGSNGLFPYIKGDVSFKNIKVTDSYISSKNNVGAIFGSTFKNENNLNSISIENCIVVGNYLHQTTAGSANGWNNVAGLGGSIGVVTKSVLVNNCAIVDNYVNNASAVNNMKTRAFFGNFLNYDAAVVKVSIKNSFTDLNTYANGYYPNNSANYSNIYTTNTEGPDSQSGHDVTVLSSTADMKGATALSVMELDKNVWVANNGYPEISAFHSLLTVSVDSNSHKTICLHKIGGVSCSISFAEEEHLFVPNADNIHEDCACGFSKEIVGNVIVPNNQTIAKWEGGWSDKRPTTFEASGITKGTGYENDPYIIETPKQLYYIAQRAPSAETVGKYYKVADNVAVFDFMGSASDSNANWGLGDHTRAFQGYFDGNGVEIRNLYVQGYHAALFPTLGGNATVKNIKVVGATASSTSGQAGGIYGNVINAGTILIENCVVTDSSITTSSSGCVGAIGGVTSGAILTVKNCFIANNGSINLIGYPSNAGNQVQDSIVIGNKLNSSNFNAPINVYTTNAVTGNGAVKAMGFDSNVWFDTEGYPELYAFHDIVYIYVDENTHKGVCQHFVNDIKCTTCTFASEHVLKLNEEGTLKVCSCGYSVEINGNTLKPNNKSFDTWDGTQVEPTKTDSNGNILITTAEELAWIALKGDAATAGKSYKVADGIGAFYLTPNGAASYDNSSFDRLKETLTASTDLKGSTLNKWVCKSYVAAVGGWASFQGSFDGNGITIYGMPGQSTDSGSNGLFPYIKGDVSFKNIKVTDSYISSKNNVGAIFGSTFNNSNTLNSISIENCIVVGNYLNQTTAGSANGWNNVAGLGGSIGVVTKSVLVNNCAIVDNYVNNASAVNNMKTRAFFGNFLNYDAAVVTVSIKNSFTDLNTYANGYYPNNNANYSNIYTTNTDAPEFYSGHDVTVLSSTADMKGANAISTLELDESVWFNTTSYPEMYKFHDMTTVCIDENKHQFVCQVFINGEQCSACQPVTSHTMVDAEDGKSSNCVCGYGYEIKGIHAMNIPESILNRIVNNTVYTEKFATNSLFKAAYSEDIYGSDTISNVFDMYATSLSLKVSNPHIGFTFAFHGEYKTNKANITATFKVDGQVVATVTGAEMINNAGAGRYHLYRLKGLHIGDLCKPVTVTVNYNGNTFDFGTYSAAGYAISAMNAGEEYQEHVNASMALVYYSEMIAARAKV